MIDLSGRPPDWPAEVVDLWADCVQRAVRRPNLWREPAPRGDELLRQMLGEHLGLDPEHLTITASLRAAVLTYARYHDRVLLERPT
jgi:DNA-binding transcriptional MocR family regulator